MTIADLIDSLSLRVITKGEIKDRKIVDAYVGDLLSDVMANSREGSVWITLQTHLNIVAVASMKSLPAILIVNGRLPDAEIISKADEEGIALLGTDEPAFPTAGKIYTRLRA